MATGLEVYAKVDPPNMRRQNFHACWTIGNYNDTSASCAFPSGLLEMAGNRRIIITDVTLTHVTSIGVTMDNVTIETGNGSPFYLDNHTTTKAHDVWNSNHLYIPVLPTLLTPTELTFWFRIYYLANYLATDDITVFIRGYIEPVLEAMPVELKEVSWNPFA